MKVLLIRAICLMGTLSITICASDVALTRSGGPAHQEESGVMTHGTVSHVRNNQIVVLSPESREPIRFSHGEGTVYIDDSGNPLTLKFVRSGVAVTVFYSQAEGQRMANKVIVGDTPPL